MPAKQTKQQITAVLTRHRRRNRDQKAAALQAALREPRLSTAAPVAAYGPAAVAHARLLLALNEQTDVRGRAGKGASSRAPGR
ncbi:hypothetical protein [Streptomyces sp. NPDC001508]|uniref:hypothetical protein n=1 Tax=Streptomyces sp. NPDC001508 TaxID=3154656 RepID=UPI003322B01F